MNELMSGCFPSLMAVLISCACCCNALYAAAVSRAFLKSPIARGAYGGPIAGRLVIICGLPGSGKTTLAEAIARDRQGFLFSGDEWMVALGVDIWDQEFRTRAEALQWELAQRLLELDVTVVIEWGVWSRRERDELREGARALGAGVELHYLEEPVEVLWERVRLRDREAHVGRRAMTRDDFVEWSAVFEAPGAEELALFDPPG